MDKGFLVFGDIEETLNELSDEEVGKLFRGMVSYHNTGEKPDFSDPALKYAFIPIRQQMDRGAEAYQKKCEKNRANALKRSSDVERSLAMAANASDVERSLAMAANASDGSLTKTKTKTDTKTDTDTDTKSAPADVWSLSRSVLGYLNDRAGTSYRTDKAEYVQLISELSHQGYTEADMVRVVDVKCADWQNNPEMAQFLRPSTLFGDKFGEYLAQPLPEAVAKRERAEKRSADNAERVKAFEAELVTVQERIASADTATRIQLREREAWLQDEIARLSG